MALDEAVAEHGPWPARSVCALGAGLAEALEAIHKAGLIHRDLKPSNVLVAADGPRVVDFGISVAAEATALTRTGMVVGTPGFMAPEQLTGATVTPATDVFALGAVLVYAATGVGPFGTGSAQVLNFRIAYEEPDLSGLPADLAIVGRCLAKDPAQRPQVSEILDELALEAPESGGYAPTQLVPGAAEWLPAKVAEALTVTAPNQAAPVVPAPPSTPPPQGDPAAPTAPAPAGNPPAPAAPASPPPAAAAPASPSPASPSPAAASAFPPPGATPAARGPAAPTAPLGTPQPPGHPRAHARAARWLAIAAVTLAFTMLQPIDARALPPANLVSGQPDAVFWAVPLLLSIATSVTAYRVVRRPRATPVPRWPLALHIVTTVLSTGLIAALFVARLTDLDTLGPGAYTFALSCAFLIISVFRYPRRQRRV